MVELYGFDSEPFATVLWLVNGVVRFKTICYSDVEIKQAIALTSIKGHFHYEREYRIVLHRPIESMFSKKQLVG